MFVRWFLFETGIGELLLTLMEKTVGLAVVQSEWLADQPSGKPQTASGE